MKIDREKRHGVQEARPSQSARAVVFTAPGKVAFADLAVNDPGPDEVQVRTSFSMMSAGTELGCLQDKAPMALSSPIAPGYQRVGEVVAVGRNALDWAIGDRDVATISSLDGPVTSLFAAHISIANTPVDNLFRLPEHVHDLAGSRRGAGYRS
jgi:NADPH:quinone reductase-like Zn-dependent oxidoreductase